MKKHYKKLLLVSILVVLMLASTMPALGAPDKVRVFVEFTPGAKGKVQQMLNQEGAEFHYTFDELNSFVVTVPGQAIKGLERNPNVVEIEEDVPRYLVESIPVQTAVETAAMWEDIGDIDNIANEEILPWGVQAVQAPQVWDSVTPSKGDGVTVCIIDTGYYADHLDLPDGVPGYSQMITDYDIDGYGHGSHVAGTIAAMDNEIGVIGVSPNVNLYIIKYFGDDGAATLASDLIAAANTCADNGADIISMSLGGTRSARREERAFDNLYAAGVLSIAAAGNDENTAYSYPASYDSVVSVAAVDSSLDIAYFSQQNDQVEISAPGVGVLSTLPYVETSYITVEGETYSGFHVEFSAYGDVSGALVDGGYCGSPGDWSGKVVLCERGDEISFADKILNVEAGGGVAALIYNNIPDEDLLATMGEEYDTIIGIGYSQEIGQALMGKLNSNAVVHSEYDWPTSGYEAWGGTSMATPHVSAVAALLWSYNPGLTNQEIRDAMNDTAMQLGDTDRDNTFGYGLVQAYDALVAIGGGGTVNEAPVVTITSPADGISVDEGTAITFAANATDTEDGDLAGSLAWTSSLDGPIDSGASFTTSALSVGTHTITASVTDSGGKPGSDAISVTVISTTPNSAPTVTITAPGSGTSVEEGTSITFAATAADTEDGDLKDDITWTSSLDGGIGSGAGVTTSGLSVGTHTITASVTDSGGLPGSDIITVEITESSTGGTLTVDVSTDKTTPYTDKQRVYVTVLVTDDGTPKSGASVAVTMTTGDGDYKYYSGTTGADGTYTFSYRVFVRKDGSGTFTVDADVTLAGYDPESGSTTFYVNP